MDINFNWIIELKHNLTAKGVLAVSAFLISIIFFVISLFSKTELKPTEYNLKLKIAASFLIASIAYLSDSGFAYSIAIFIIATMVTKLDFIENIAGIMRNSDAWRKFREAQMGVATQEEKQKANQQNEPEQIKQEAAQLIKEQIEKEEKAEKEKANNIKQEQQIPEKEEKEIYRKHVNSFSVFLFEKEALDQLENDKLFGEIIINRSIKLQIRNVVKRVYDAFVRKETTDFIIETKLVKTSVGIKYVLLQVKDYMEELQQFNVVNQRYANIKGLIIIPDCDFNDTIQENIAILKFDITRKQFTNIEEVRNWINQ